MTEDLYVCQRCQVSGPTRSGMCHPYHSILVEPGSVRRDQYGRVIDCAQATRAKAMRAAKVSR